MTTVLCIGELVSSFNRKLGPFLIIHAIFWVALTSIYHIGYSNTILTSSKYVTCIPFPINYIIMKDFARRFSKSKKVKAES